jgi:hypothetical protein
MPSTTTRYMLAQSWHRTLQVSFQLHPRTSTVRPCHSGPMPEGHVALRVVQQTILHQGSEVSGKPVSEKLYNSSMDIHLTQGDGMRAMQVALEKLTIPELQGVVFVGNICSCIPCSPTASPSQLARVSPWLVAPAYVPGNIGQVKWLPVLFLLITFP